MRSWSGPVSFLFTSQLSSIPPRGVRTLCALLLSAGAAGAQFTPEPSDPAALFAPVGGEVPLSEFVTASGPVTVSVRPDILAWIQSHGGRTRVVKPDGTKVPSYVNMNTGEFTCFPTQTTQLVVVSNILFNHLYDDQQGSCGNYHSALVTHWNACKNDDPTDGLPPRGGQEPDARDGVSRIDYAAGGLTRADYQLYDDTGRFDPALGTPDGLFVYATHKTAFFSDGTEATDVKDGDVADEDVPGYERYFAENWSLLAVSKLAAIHLSDQSRAKTGLPVAHRNPGPAFSPTAPAHQRLQEDLPILQIVHAYIVAYDDPNQIGTEDSLASFIVPPHWTADPEEEYPVLFNAFYDVNDSTFFGPGPYFLEVIGQLALEGRQAIAVMSNGGGASCSITMQASIFAGMEKLFSAAGEAGDKLAIDRLRVVATGGSRGSMPALGLSASPNHPQAFVAKYVIAGGPLPYAANVFEHHANPTYGLLQGAPDIGTGYVNSWRETWTGPAPEQLTGQEMALQTFFGSSDYATVAASLDLGSAPLVQALAAKGTRVILRTGTHDYAKPFGAVADYYAALVAAGVPTRLEIGYRFGHGGAAFTEPGVTVQPDELELMRRVIDGDPAPAGEEGVYHFRPESPEDEWGFIGRPFVPARAPMVLEAPLMAALGQSQTFSITGPPGTSYGVYVQQIDAEEWADSFEIEYLPGSQPVLLFSGQLPSAPPGTEITWATHTILTPPDAFAWEGPWQYGLGYLVPGDQSWTWTTTETSTPPAPSSANIPWMWDVFNTAPVFFWGNWLEFGASHVLPTSNPAEHFLALIPPYDIPAGTRTGGLSTDLDE